MEQLTKVINIDENCFIKWKDSLTEKLYFPEDVGTVREVVRFAESFTSNCESFIYEPISSLITKQKIRYPIIFAVVEYAGHFKTIKDKFKLREDEARKEYKAKDRSDQRIRLFDGGKFEFKVYDDDPEDKNNEIQVYSLNPYQSRFESFFKRNRSPITLEFITYDYLKDCNEIN